MTTSQTQSPLDNQPFFSFIRRQIENGETNAGIARWLSTGFEFDGLVFGLETSADSIRRFRARHGLTMPTANKTGIKIDGDDAIVTSPARPYPHMDDPDAMLRERGLDPEQWIIQGATVNEWDGPKSGGSVTTYHQAKLVLKRRNPELQILPARSEGWRPSPEVLLRDSDTQLIVVCGDQQAPFHDKDLHAAFCQWLAFNKPSQGILLGDTIDLPDISRHRLDPENTATVNECIQSGYDVLRDYVVSSTGTKFQMLAGNHDERLRNILLDKPSVQPLFGLKQADSETEEGYVAMSLPWLLRLDELGIDYVDPSGAYALGQINVNRNLAVRHGWIARQGSGASALATLEHLGYSVIVGHTHRQSIVYKTTHDIDGKTSTLTAAEAGCMCKVSQETAPDGRKWPNYTGLPDWQQGFSTVTIHPNGLFRIENATWVNNSLLWRDQCYTV